MASREPIENRGMALPRWSIACSLVVASIAAASITACSSVPERNPLPEELADSAVIPGIPLQSRYWGDEPPPWADAWLAQSDEELAARFGGVMDREHNYLAISGGGQNGAYGAGLLVGWSELGTRPEFTMVTGISTGALTAPFAFLGPEYDDKLREIYTSYSTDDLIDMRGKLAVLMNDAAADSAPLRAKIAHLIDAEMVEAMAVEYRKGRTLLVMTTHLDAGRPITWNVTRIAASDAPNKVSLIHDVLLASASIPGVMPPVMFQVEADGKLYDEMHVDGGAMAQVFLYPAGLDWGQVEERLRVEGDPTVYVIRNSRLRPDWVTVRRRTLPIFGRSVVSLLRTQGIGDIYRIYLQALDDDIDFNLARVPDDFDHESKETFDAEYMRALFDVGYRQMLAGDSWEKTPPGFEPQATP